MAERTIIWDIFDYLFEADRRRMVSIQPIRAYRNPIFLALEWAEAMEGGNFRSQRAFAKAIGLSHGRVSQAIGLLRLSSEVLKDLEGLGDPLASRMITERKPRHIVKLSKAEEKRRLKELLE